MFDVLATAPVFSHERRRTAYPVVETCQRNGCEHHAAVTWDRPCLTEDGEDAIRRERVCWVCWRSTKEVQ